MHFTQTYFLHRRPTLERIAVQAIVPQKWGTLANSRVKLSGPLARVLGLRAADIHIQSLRYHQLLILVPSPEAAGAIVPGSAVVGVLQATEDGSAPIECYYEGAIYGQIMSFEDKVRHAAGRLFERYPTTARVWLPRHEVEPVGCYALREDYEDGQLWIWNPQQLLAWCRTPEP